MEKFGIKLVNERVRERLSWLEELSKTIKRDDDDEMMKAPSSEKDAFKREAEKSRKTCQRLPFHFPSTNKSRLAAPTSIQ